MPNGNNNDTYIGSLDVLLRQIVLMKTLPDANLPFVTQLETTILEERRSPERMMQAAGMVPPAGMAPPGGGMPSEMMGMGMGPAPMPGGPMPGGGGPMPPMPPMGGGPMPIPAPPPGPAGGGGVIPGGPPPNPADLAMLLGQ